MSVAHDDSPPGPNDEKPPFPEAGWRLWAGRGVSALLSAIMLVLAVLVVVACLLLVATLVDIALALVTL